MDNLAIWAVIIGIGIGIGLLAFFRFRKKKIEPPFPFPASFAFEYAADGDPWVRSNVPVPAEALAAIREGVEIQIARSSARRPDFTLYGAPIDYIVCLIDPMATNTVNTPGSPAILVRGIPAAGTCLGVGDGVSNVPIIVLPHQQNQNWQFIDYLRDSARYESEHIRLFANDREMFNHYQGANDSHPIFD